MSNSYSHIEDGYFKTHYSFYTTNFVIEIHMDCDDNTRHLRITQIRHTSDLILSQARYPNSLECSVLVDDLITHQELNKTCSPIFKHYVDYSLDEVYNIRSSIDNITRNS